MVNLTRFYIFLKRVGVLFAFLLFFSLEAKEIIFEPAVANFTVDGKASKSLSSQLKINVNEIRSSYKRELNATSAPLWTSTLVNKNRASIGEVLKYTIEVQNHSKESLTDITVINSISKGLSYELDSFSVADFSEDKKSFSYSIDELQAGEKVTISYIAYIDISAKSRVNSNSFIVHEGKRYADSFIETEIDRDFVENSIIVGTIVSEDREISTSNIKLYLDSGVYTKSDKFGKFYFKNISKREHVVSVDSSSLPDGVVLIPCSENSKNMGSSISYFVDTTISDIKEVNFCLKRSKLEEAERVKNSFNFKIENQDIDKMPEYTYLDIEKEQRSGIFLWPKESYMPHMPSIKVAFLRDANEKMVLYLNGKKVDILNFDGYVKSKDKRRVIDKYRGIDIKDGKNLLEARIFTNDGTLKDIVKKRVHLSTAPVKAELIEEKSYLIADGKNSPVLAIKLYDIDGYPLRQGMVGTFTLQKPYFPKKSLTNPITDTDINSRYTVSKNGITYIELEPTSISGEVKLQFPFQDSSDFITTWIQAESREWLIVGFAQGSVGYQEIEDNLQDISKKEFYSDGKISFFAKGKIKGDLLLTMAYDNKKRGNLGLMEEIDPDSEYIVYSKASTQKNETPSSKKLYLKIEKEKFYALFGDFDTGFNTKELSRYERRLNGVKSEFQTDTIEYSAFISESQNSFYKEEIQGDGTSGYYYLKRDNIVISSQKVYLQIRDRYREEIILSKKPLRAIYDYNIDYSDGTLYFKEAIAPRDESGNRQFIVVEYETKDGDKKRYSYGAKGGVKFFDGRLKFGATAISQEDKDSTDRLIGVDAKFKVDNKITINAEYAKSNSSAYLFEVNRMDRYSKTKLYYKRQDSGFGLGQQNIFSDGAKSYGVESALNYYKNIALKLSIYSDKSLKSKNSKDVAEIITTYRYSTLLASLGYRFLSSSADKDGSKSQLVSTISKGFFKNKIRLLASYEFGLNGKSDAFADRTFAQATYFINQYIEIFSNYEILDAKSTKRHNSSVGLKGKPWRGATIKSGVSQRSENSFDALFGDIGLNQNIHINRYLTVSANFSKEQTLKGEDSSRDYISYSLGASYAKKRWVYNSKVEQKISKKDKKTNLNLGLYREISRELGLAAGVRAHSVKDEAKSSSKYEAKLSLAYRPDSSLTTLAYLKHIYEKQNISKTSKFIATTLFVSNLTNKFQLSGHYGIKYIQESINKKSYEDIINRLGLEVTYDINRLTEIGVTSSMLHSYSRSDTKSSFGLYLGYLLYKNSYLGIGYNFNGFSDGDFSELTESKKGVYLKFRLKFDNNSLKEVLR